jgi:glycosyltransferase involved in cell wall biosynthesis
MDAGSKFPMPKSPQVSIITPTYNHEKYIGSCIESVLQQTYPNWEHIVIDDGSTDRTPEIVRGYSDKRIRYFHQPNKGIEALAHTYNQALSMAKGEFVAILEGDDLWPPDKLSSLIPNFTNGNIVLAYGGVAEISADGTWSGRLGRAVRRRRSLPSVVLFNNPVGSATHYMLRADGADLIPASTVVIRKSALESIGGFQYFPNLCVTDFPTFISLTLQGSFYYTPQVTGYRRRHRKSATYENQAQISAGVRNYAKYFVNHHNLSLTSEQMRIIERTWHASACDSEFSAGRLCLLNGRWQEGRSHFRHAFNLSLPRLFMAAAVGWIFTWLHCDLEFLLGLVGIATLRDDATLKDLSRQF